jgi:hypothetical protein
LVALAQLVEQLAQARVALGIAGVALQLFLDPGDLWNASGLEL